MNIEVKKKHGVGAFILAGTSFIPLPLIGVFTGIISMTTSNKPLKIGRHKRRLLTRRYE